MKYVKSLLAGLAMLALPAAVNAEEFPSKPITIIVGYPAGGTNDLLARAVAEQMSLSLGQPVVVENVPGATGLIGLKQLVAAAPDGYTIGLGAPSILAVRLALAKDVKAELGFDPRVDVAPVALLAQTPFMVVVNSQVPVSTLDELVQYSKANPGTLSYGSNGVGGISHLIGEFLTNTLGLDAVHVPYKGDPEVTTGLLGNEVQIAFPLAATGALAQVEQGNFHVLATTGSERLSRLPDTPSLTETPSLDKFTASTWFGVFAPRGTPDDIVERLNSEINKALAAEKTLGVLSTSGLESKPLSVGEMRAFVASEQDSWKVRIDALGLELTGN